MTDALATIKGEIATAGSRVADAERVATQFAKATAFQAAELGKATNTKAAHLGDLNTFARYLHMVTGEHSEINGQQLATDPEQWRDMGAGLLTAFKLWMLEEGYAIGTLNRRFATVKKYMKLACAVGVIDDEEKRRINDVHSFTRKEATNIDLDRATTRIGAKKAHYLLPTLEQMRALKAQPNTPQGHRDLVIICMLAEMGLRVGELIALETKSFDLQAGTVTFYRQKVQLWQTHKLTADSLRAIANWLDRRDTEPGPLLRASIKGGKHLTHRGLSVQAVTQRVRTLGKRVGLDGLGSHDLRHYWATNAVRTGTPIEIIREAGGWKSWEMVLLYAAASKIANEGLLLTF